MFRFATASSGHRRLLVTCAPHRTIPANTIYAGLPSGICAVCPAHRIRPALVSFQTTAYRRVQRAHGCLHCHTPFSSSMVRIVSTGFLSILHGTSGAGMNRGKQNTL